MDLEEHTGDKKNFAPANSIWVIISTHLGTFATRECRLKVTSGLLLRRQVLKLYPLSVMCAQDDNTARFVQELEISP